MSLATTEQVKSVLNTVEAHGYDLTLTHVSGGSYAPGGSVSGTTATDTNVRGVFIDYRIGQVPQEYIERGDRKLVISSLFDGVDIGTTPVVGDTVSGEGQTVTIEEVRTYNRQNEILAYNCRVRR